MCGGVTSLLILRVVSNGYKGRAAEAAAVWLPGVVKLREVQHQIRRPSTAAFSVQDEWQKWGSSYDLRQNLIA
eukprot:COSAG01_NODE_3525_length_5972_cov_20.753618_1_plen_73_part_00